MGRGLFRYAAGDVVSHAAVIGAKFAWRVNVHYSGVAVFTQQWWLDTGQCSG
ncbi:hypothetical protein [Paenibacillus sp. JGP012]|uniref:hypothetical protein n=1 Tax=Paenibacillus sp. JGP012 TaxID=2735914 RepID=UPI00161B3580|nr:hypothetical protein [Paenibacillus sp. JGP012]